MVRYAFSSLRHQVINIFFSFNSHFFSSPHPPFLSLSFFVVFLFSSLPPFLFPQHHSLSFHLPLLLYFVFVLFLLLFLNVLLYQLLFFPIYFLLLYLSQLPRLIFHHLLLLHLLLFLHLIFFLLRFLLLSLPSFLHLLFFFFFASFTLYSPFPLLPFLLSSTFFFNSSFLSSFYFLRFSSLSSVFIFFLCSYSFSSSFPCFVFIFILKIIWPIHFQNYL